MRSDRRKDTIAYVGGKKKLLPPLARSAHDLKIICGACRKQMRIEVDTLICTCGHTDCASEVFDDVMIAGPFVGCEVILYPDEEV
jgi:hypothetical protein